MCYVGSTPFQIRVVIKLANGVSAYVSLVPTRSKIYVPADPYVVNLF